MPISNIKKLHKELKYSIDVKKLKDLDCIVLQFPKINIRESDMSGKVFCYTWADEFVQVFSEEDEIMGAYQECPSYAKLAIIYTDIVLKLLTNNFHTDLVSVYDDKKQINGISSLYRIVPIKSSDMVKAKQLLTISNDFIMGEPGATLAKEFDVLDGYDIIVKIIGNLGLQPNED